MYVVSAFFSACCELSLSPNTSCQPPMNTFNKTPCVRVKTMLEEWALRCPNLDTCDRWTFTRYLDELMWIDSIGCDTLVSEHSVFSPVVTYDVDENGDHDLSTARYTDLGVLLDMQCDDENENECGMQGESSEVIVEPSVRRKCTSAEEIRMSEMEKLVADLQLAHAISVRQMNKAQEERRKILKQKDRYVCERRIAERKKTNAKKARRNAKPMLGEAGIDWLVGGNNSVRIGAVCEEVGITAQLAQAKLSELDVGGINNLTSKVSGIMDSLQNLVGTASEMSIMDVFLGLVNLYAAFANASATSALTALVLLTRSFGLAKAGMSGVIDYVMAFVKGSASDEETETGEQMRGQGLTLNPFKILAGLTGVIATAMEMTLGCVSDPLRVITRHLAELTKLQKGIEGTQKLMVMCYDQLKSTYYRMRYDMSVEEYESRTKFPRYAQAAALAKVISTIPLGPINRYKDLAVQINLIDNELKTLQAEATRNANHVMRSLMTESIRMCMTQTAAARESPAIACKSRTAPHCSLVYGRSGVGKSQFVQFLKYKLYGDIFHKVVPDFAACSFDRKVETEFWDSYRRQPIVTYDDFAQRVDMASQPNPEGLEIIYAVNTNPYQLHMSDIKDKSSTFFDSSVIICTTNTKLPKFKSLTDQTAVLRRFDRFVEVTIKPEFGILTNAGSDEYYRFDERKADALKEETGTRYSMDHYIVQEYDMDGKHVKNYTFEEYYAVYKEDVERNLKKGSTMHEEMCLATGVQCDASTTEDSEYYDDYMKELDLARTISVIQDRTEERVENAKVECESLAKNAFAGAMDYLEPLKAKTTNVKALVTKYTSEAVAYIEGAYEKIKSVASRVSSAVSEKMTKMWDLMMTCFGAMCGKVETVVEGNPRMTALLIACFALSVAVSYGMRQWMNPPQRDAADMLAEFTSGDKKTMRRRRAARGEFSSGDKRTMRRKRLAKAEELMGEEEHVEVESKCAYVSIDEDGDPEVEVFGEGCQVRAAQATAAMMRNAVYIQVHRESGAGVCSTGMFLVGRTMLVVAHCLPKDATSISLYNPAQRVSNVTIPMNQLKITRLNRSTVRPVDLALVTFPNIVTARPAIVKNFAEASRFGDIGEGTLVASTIRRYPHEAPVAKANLIFGEEFTHEYARCTTRKYLTGERTDVSGAVIEEEQVVEVNDVLEYYLDTRAGMCGSLISVDNDCFVSKFVGIHVAGNGHKGYAVATSKEFLTRSLEEHVRMHGLNGDAVVNARVPYGEASVDIRDEVVDVVLDGDCVGMGKAPCASRPTKTKLNPSLIQNLVHKTTTRPARLGPFVGPDGETINPLKKGLKKVLGPQTLMDEKIMKIATADYFEVLSKNKGKPRVLTYEEAITGGDLEMLGPMNRQTSAGYPWSMTTNQPGKRKWLGVGEDWDLHNEELKEACEKLKEHARNNERGDVVFTAQLKDERRDNAKVDIGKTRVFESAPIHYVVVFRQYFGYFVDHCMKSCNRIDNEMCVGINPYSEEWDKLARKLRSKGKKTFAGDFGNFDGSISSNTQSAFCEEINAFYDDGEENAQIRRILMMHTYNADVMVDGNIIRQTHSHPSGHPGTVIWNCIIGSVAMRQCYYMCALDAGVKWNEIPRFRDVVSLATYGDDNAANVADSVADWFNQETVTKAMAELGYTYTDEAKSGVCVKFRDVENISFLKRKFVYNYDWNMHVAPMELSTILDIPNWVRGRELRQATVQNVETVQRELALHGREVYNQYIPQFRAALATEDLSADLSSFEYWEMVLASDRGQV